MVSSSGLLEAARAWLTRLLAVLAVGFVSYMPLQLHDAGDFAEDFHNAYWPAARAIIEGDSPYVDPQNPIVEQAAAFVYPAPAALLFAPFGLLSRGEGDVVFVVVVLLSLVLALWLLDVRDWRVYALASLTAPVFNAWQTGNVSLPLVLVVGLLWRCRDRAPVAGLAVAFAVCLKLFLWPLAIWLLATRRYRAMVWALGTGIVLNLVSWAVLGFDEIGRYWDLIRALADSGEERAYTVMRLLLDAGVPRGVSYAVGLSVAGAVLLLAVRVGRRGDHLAALTLTLSAALLAAPLTWLHSLTLLMAPLAVLSPRLSLLWGMTLLYWVGTAFHPTSAEPAVGLVLSAAIVTVMLSPRLLESVAPSRRAQALARGAGNAREVGVNFSRRNR